VTDLSKYDIDIENQTNLSSTNIRLSFLSLLSIGNAELHKFFVIIDIWSILERDWSVMICTDIQKLPLVQASIIEQNGRRQINPFITKKCENYSLLQCSALKDVCFLRRTDCVLFHAWSSGITWWLV